MMFVTLWVAYLQLHQFEETHEISSNSDGAEWVCKFDNTKMVRLNDHVASLITPEKNWEIHIRDEDIIGLSDYQNGENEHFGRVTKFDSFGSSFEDWLAKAFETMKCNPDSHINFPKRIKQEKSFVATLLLLSESLDSVDSVEYPTPYFYEDTPEVQFHLRNTGERTNSDDPHLVEVKNVNTTF